MDMKEVVAYYVLICSFEVSFRVGTWSNCRGVIWGPIIGVAGYDTQLQLLIPAAVNGDPGRKWYWLLPPSGSPGLRS